jgi:hypothetical protein
MLRSLSFDSLASELERSAVPQISIPEGPTMTSADPQVSNATLAATPTGIRVASTICWVIAFITLCVAIAVYLPALDHTTDSLVVFGSAMAAAIMVGGAAILVRRRRKTGAYLVILAWALPTILSLATGGGARPGSPLLFAAMIGLLINWKHFE